MKKKKKRERRDRGTIYMDVSINGARRRRRGLRDPQLFEAVDRQLWDPSDVAFRV